jgi:uncharacterized protein
VKDNWIQTWTGKQFWFLEPKIESIDIRDIAHALSLVCRYNGHVNKFYSVAQHSVLVSQLCKPCYALYGLLHDASEAYTGDCVTPLKKLMPNFQDIEDNIMRLVCKKFRIKLSKACEANIKLYDQLMLATEVRDLIPTRKKDGNWLLREPLNFKIMSWKPRYAEKIFLKRFEELTSARNSHGKKSI